MKRFRLLLVLIGVPTLIAIAFALRHPAGPDVFANLKPYAYDDKTVYVDMAAMYKKMGTPASLTPKNASPMMMRSLKLKDVAFGQVEEIMHRDLTQKRRWNFVPKSLGLPEDYIAAYEGPTISPTSIASAQPEHLIIVSPDVTAQGYMSTGKPPKNVRDFQVIESRKLATWEVWWLRVKNLGKNPFTDDFGLMF